VSELPTGAYAPAHTTGDDPSKTRQVVEQGKDAAGQAVSETKDTAAQQAQRVAAEAKSQVRSVAGDVKGRLGEQARTQNDRLVSGIRQTADHLDEMRGDRSGTPAATVVSRVADSGRQLADYLDRNGLEGALTEVQDFARRRPGAFLAAALAAGFVVGRLGKSIAQADATAGQPDTVTPSVPTAGTQARTYPAATTYPTSTVAPDPAYVAGTGAGYVGTGAPATTGTYTTTEYEATGTGTPLVVEEGYSAVPGRETRP
jgi:hypothetical protein